MSKEGILITLDQDSDCEIHRCGYLEYDGVVDVISRAFTVLWRVHDGIDQSKCIEELFMEIGINIGKKDE